MTKKTLLGWKTKKKHSMYKWQKLDATFWEVTNVTTKKKAILSPSAFHTMSSLFFALYMRTK